jgi:hypothetical protein
MSRKAREQGPGVSHLRFADDVNLFTGNSMHQIQEVRRCLDLFCAYSGQKVSIAKTRILFFSKNVSLALENSIVQASAFSKYDYLGRYLGAPSLHFRITRSTYHHFVEKVQHRRRLSG